MSYDSLKKDIAKANVGRAMEALELASIENPALKQKIKRIIYYTFEDTYKNVKDENENEQKKSTL
jgi:hypothetical protein